MADVTQRTGRRTSLSTLLVRLQDRWPGLGDCLLGGAGAAVLGLGSFALLVMVLWISLPYPDHGSGGALRLAAGLWLLAHGVVLVRDETLSGVPAPVGVTPLLLALWPVWLLHRAGRDGAYGGHTEEDDAPLVGARMAWCGVAAGYLGVGVLAALYASGGALRPSWTWGAMSLPLVVVVAVGVGVWTAYGRPYGPLPRAVRHALDLPSVVRLVLTVGAVDRDGRVRLGDSLRAALAGVAVLMGGGALLVGTALLWHGEAARATFLQLANGWSGRCAVLLLAVALVPNAAVWGASYGLGPGFVLGVGHVMGPLSMARPPELLPPFPLLAAVPRAGGGPSLWTVGAVPLAAGVTVGWFVARAACAGSGRGRDSVWPAGRTVGAAVVAGVVCGVVTGVLAQAAGGPLGVAALARFGPVGWQVGAAAAGWVVAVGVPVAAGARVWRLRRGGPLRGTRTSRETVPPVVVPAPAASEPAQVPGGGKWEWMWDKPLYRPALPAPGQSGDEGGEPEGAWEDPDLKPYEVLPAEDPFLPEPGPSGRGADFEA
ncbi:DUF6350 family protein [Streptomyces sp. NPDC047022]|uniref:cell division protein PerM n=1 Tax=Streptomyces sp. NPDC047022 TaxID=3155737 RepID=UPI0033DD210B